VVVWDRGSVGGGLGQGKCGGWSGTGEAWCVADIM
jgi:hypothetical protein